MENSPIPAQQANTTCTACTSAIVLDDNFCNSCGYPVKGTEEEKDNFMANRISKQIDLNTHAESMKKAGYSLYWIAGSFLLFGFIMFAVNQEAEDAVFTLILNIVLSAVFALLGVWSRNKPLTAFIVALTLYGLITILNAIVEPASLLRGIIVKIVVVTWLIKGMKAAMDAEKLSRELN
ncbi:efflux RND transporter permease subunit [Mucilaginibacter sp. UR6-1]|uniref:efflux RND transporter permease subunit n=1 Tax=Mucilaginibacter sp. UR6-1 TaxID=1435643 RepID=UPI001E49EBA5|nr:efflux RND transporter permease subunit [Mucilaginibacter sp. UR6-1]MCC8407638.1 efflux RND transporter permease subunit [Mucilaginibacter sp. UR6-1]